MSDDAEDRHFTVDEVNALVPDLQVRFDRLSELCDEATVLAAELAALGVDLTSDEGGDPDTPEVRERRAKLAHLADRIQADIDEVERIGGEVKDIAKGLVDFRSRHRGRTVYLCWRRGEARVAHYHDLDTGFSGRRDLEDPDEFHGTYLH